MQKVFVGTYSIINGGYGDDTPKTLDAQLAEIKRLGYDGVEFLANDLENHSPEEIRELLDKYGLEAYSSHMTVDAMEGLFEKGQAIGLKYFFSARENIMTAEDAMAVAEKLNELAKKAAPYGIKVGYHNHAMEFWMDGRKTLEEILIEASDPDVVFQLDCGWATAAGTHAPSFIRRYSGRFVAVHVKENNKVWGPDEPYIMPDMKPGPDGEVSEEAKAAMAEMMKTARVKMATQGKLGADNSNVDYVEIKKALLEQNIGEPLFVVEREFTYTGTRAQCLEEDCAWLKENL